MNVGLLLNLTVFGIAVVTACYLKGGGRGRERSKRERKEGSGERKEGRRRDRNMYFVSYY